MILADHAGKAEYSARMRLKGAEDLLRGRDDDENDEHDNFITQTPCINAGHRELCRYWPAVWSL